MHRPIHSQTHTLGTGGGSATQEVQELDRERLRCVVPERGLEGQLPLSLCRRPPQGKYTGRRHLSWVEPSFCTASSEAALAGRGRPAPPPSTWETAPHNPQIAHRGLLLGSQPHPMHSLSCTFMGRQQPSACATCTQPEHYKRDFWDHATGASPNCNVSQAERWGLQAQGRQRLASL